MDKALRLGSHVLHALSKLRLGWLFEVVRGRLQLVLDRVEVQIVHRHCLWLHVQRRLRAILQ